MKRRYCALLFALAGCVIELDYGATEPPARDGGVTDPTVGVDASPAHVDAGVSCGVEPCPKAIAVGSFAKSTVSSPTLQTIDHDLGQTPRLLFLWTAGAAAGAGQGTLAGFGVTDATRGSRAVGFASADDEDTPNTARAISNEALTLVRAVWAWPEVVAEASVDSWDDQSFTLRWFENDNRPVLVHYLAIAGDGVSSKVVRWIMPTAPGQHAVDGVGFRPDAVVHLHAGHGITQSAPYVTRDAAFGLGAMDGTHQWALEATSIHGEFRTTARRAQRTDACLFAFHADRSTTKRAVFDGMSDDGFDLDFAEANDFPSQAASVAIAGLPVRAGCFTKTDDTVQAVTGVGFRPEAVLFTSVQTAATSAVSSDLRLAIGAATATSAAAAAVSEADDLATSAVYSVDQSGVAYLLVDADGTTPRATATLESFSDDGFSLRWTGTTESSPQICYLAFGRP